MINKENVQHIAHLARLGLAEEEVEVFQKELSSVLDYFELLKEVDVSKVEPTFHSTESFFQGRLDVLREDRAESQPVETVAKLVEYSPDKKKGYIKVKAIF